MNDWRPFIYGGIASVAAESGKIIFQVYFSYVLFYSTFENLPITIRGWFFYLFILIKWKRCNFREWKSEKIHFLCEYSFGWLTNVFLTGTFPIDTTKTRLQVQGQTIDARLKEIKYRGMIHALKRIYAEEGVRALYSG